LAKEYPTNGLSYDKVVQLPMRAIIAFLVREEIALDASRAKAIVVK